jgi:hypothetical protein
MSGLQSRRIEERAHQRPASQIGLIVIAAIRVGAGKGSLCGATGARLVQHLPGERPLGFMRPPWFGRDAAERDPRLANPLALEVERYCGRNS